MVVMSVGPIRLKVQQGTGRGCLSHYCVSSFSLACAMCGKDIYISSVHHAFIDPLTRPPVPLWDSICVTVWFLGLGVYLLSTSLITESSPNSPYIFAYLNTVAMLSLNHLFFSLQCKKQLRPLGMSDPELWT